MTDQREEAEAARRRAEQDRKYSPAGPIVVWTNYYEEGWKPTSYASLDEAVRDQRTTSEWIVTRPVAWKAIEEPPPSPSEVFRAYREAQREDREGK